MAVFGVTAEPIDQTSPHFEVWEENWTIAEMFLRLSSQWVFAGMGDRIGLNYQSVDFLFRLYEVIDQVRVFEGLQLMELSALAALREGKD